MHIRQAAAHGEANALILLPAEAAEEAEAEQAPRPEVAEVAEQPLLRNIRNRQQ